MYQNDTVLDKLIEEVLKNNKEDIPSPPLSKAETWKIIDQRLKKEEQKKRFFSKRAKVYVAVLVLMLVLVPLLHPQNVTAFSWFTKYFSVIQGKITHLMGSSGQSESSGDQPPLQNQFSVVQDNMHNEQMSLEEAQKHAKFEIKIPKYIPDGYELKDVTILVTDHQKSNAIELNYIKGSEVLSIKEMFVESQMGYGTTFDNEDVKIKEVNIKNRKGTLLTFKNESNQLIWDAPRYHFELRGKITEDEIIKIAESIDF